MKKAAVAPIQLRDVSGRDIVNMHGKARSMDLDNYPVVCAWVNVDAGVSTQHLDTTLNSVTIHWMNLGHRLWGAKRPGHRIPR